MKKAKFIYGLIFTLITIISGIGFILLAVHIYKTNGYNQENVFNYGLKVLIPSIFWVALCLGAYVFYLLVPTASKVVKPYSNNELMKRLQDKLSTKSINKDHKVMKEYKKYQTFRLVALLITIAICVISLVLVILYFVDLKHFPVPSLEHPVNFMDAAKKMIMSVGVYILISFISVFACYLYFDYSSKRMISLLKELINEFGKKEISKKNNKNQELVLLCSRLLILTISITFIVLGSINGGAKDVLIKACKICTECIGLG